MKFNEKKLMVPIGGGMQIGGLPLKASHHSKVISYYPGHTYWEYLLLWGGRG